METTKNTKIDAETKNFTKRSFKLLNITQISNPKNDEIIPKITNYDVNVTKASGIFA